MVYHSDATYRIEWWRGTTRRERELMQQFDRGCNQADAARQMGISKQRVSSMTAKLFEYGLLRRNDFGRVVVTDRAYLDEGAVV